MIQAKKSLGQNFLIDQNVIKKITALVKIKENNILEIGSGTGNLTNEIIKNEPSNFILLEKDFALYKILKKKFNFQKDLEILNKDILDFELENVLKKNTIIFGNLPYNISTQILVKLIKFKKWPPRYNRLILMFQKEVAERILAKSNSPKYGRLTVISNWRLKIVDYFNISKNCFYPKPKVDSTVLVFKPTTNKIYKIKDINSLEKVTQTFFSGRRKMINKSFNKLFYNSHLFANKLNIDLSKRPSQINKENYYKITECYEKYGRVVK